MKASLLIVPFCLAVSLVHVGCASRADEPAIDPAVGTPPAAASVSLSPTAGGTLTAADGQAVLTVPAGAVARAVNVTVEVGPKEPGTAGSVYRFAPEGTALAGGATLSLRTAGVAAEPGETLVLAVKRGTTWQTLAEVRSSDQSLQTTVTALGAYALVVSRRTSPASACADECMGQAGAVCCSACGCSGEPRCTPVCSADDRWDCELSCCFDPVALRCR